MGVALHQHGGDLEPLAAGPAQQGSGFDATAARGGGPRRRIPYCPHELVAVTDQQSWVGGSTARPWVQGKGQGRAAKPCPFGGSVALSWLSWASVTCLWRLDTQHSHQLPMQPLM